MAVNASNLKELGIGSSIALNSGEVRNVLGWTLVFALLAAAGAGGALNGAGELSAMKDASAFFSFLFLVSLISGAIGKRAR